MTSRPLAIPALAVPANYWRQLGLLALLVAEVLGLSVAFDTQSLSALPSTWAHFIDVSPEAFRLVTIVAGILALLGGRSLLTDLETACERTVDHSRLPWLLLHGCGLLAFTAVTSAVVAGALAASVHPGAWTTAWLAAGGMTIGGWALAVFPAATWFQLTRRHARALGGGIAAGTAAWGLALLGDRLWMPLASYTFAAVRWVLAFIRVDAISRPADLIIGTPQFMVVIWPACSGYEGIGLITAFMALYLWLFRRTLRFPAALALVPLGAVIVWLLNAMRIVTLIVIGSAGWPRIALGGFHSQAGVLVFTAVGLGLVWLADRSGYFHEVRSRARAHATDEDVHTTAYLAPFLAVMTAAMVTGVFSTGFDWLYPVRVVAVAAVLWRCRRGYAGLTWSWSWWGLAIGIATFLLWMMVVPSPVPGKGPWQHALSMVPAPWAAAWLLFRLFGYIVTVPIAEELAFRGYLMRRLRRPDFESVPIGAFSWGSFLVSSLAFGALHGSAWVGGTMAGMTFAVAACRRGVFGEAVQAHATTNALIAVYAFTSGNWSVLS